MVHHRILLFLGQNIPETSQGQPSNTFLEIHCFSHPQNSLNFSHFCYQNIFQGKVLYLLYSVIYLVIFEVPLNQKLGSIFLEFLLFAQLPLQLYMDFQLLQYLIQGLVFESTKLLLKVSYLH